MSAGLPITDFKGLKTGMLDNRPKVHRALLEIKL